MSLEIISMTFFPPVVLGSILSLWAFLALVLDIQKMSGVSFLSWHESQFGPVMGWHMFCATIDPARLTCRIDSRPKSHQIHYFIAVKKHFDNDNS